MTGYFGAGLQHVIERLRFFGLFVALFVCLAFMVGVAISNFPAVIAWTLWLFSRHIVLYLFAAVILQAFLAGISEALEEADSQRESFQDETRRRLRTIELRLGIYSKVPEPELPEETEGGMPDADGNLPKT